jgi:hypothetical protein
MCVEDAGDLVDRLPHLELAGGDAHIEGRLERKGDLCTTLV